MKLKQVSKILMAVLLLLVPLLFRNFNYGILICGFIGIYIIAISGLDLVFGYCGQISMGHAAFFAIGAYGSALLHKYLHLPILFTMVIAAVIATLIGALLAYPASKLVFHFLSLATVAFGEIVYQLVAQSPGGITGNFTGFYTDSINLMGFKINTNTRFYYFGLVSVCIFLLMKHRLVKSKEGRAFLAIRENSHAADGMGIDVKRYKIIAFATSAFYTAFAGSMYAHYVRFISPETFSNRQSVMFLTMLLFGGTASLSGPIMGAAAVLLLNEGLRFAERYQMLIYGFMLLVVILLMPGGIYGIIKKQIDKRRVVS
ncbi:branched-chain amino acid ABC transporter permease [Lacrimispora sp.]|uniref:branched-chain amino acid ABC transporter permease n=1 Tax=Lacrimispora sp. TaxID=2719234 RepID=UPI00289C8088|nr:branched-chain amino acid ABC transporter permease [Lacrimispora sp.]